MPDTVTLIFPHQLFADHPARHKTRRHLLIEDPLFFGDPQYPASFHKQKLMLHRASMKRYAAEVLGAGRYAYDYVDYAAAKTSDLFARFAADDVANVHLCDPTDYALEKRIRRDAAKYDITLHWYENPNFLTDLNTMQSFWEDRKADDYHQTDFYIWQRKRLGIMLEAGQKPLGGKWTYDTDNRQKLKTSVALPTEPEGRDNAYIREAREYVQTHFANNPGAVDPFIYPTNHAEAETWLRAFIAHKLHDYGTYQDAITTRGNFLFHSLLSSSINSGLLAPMQVVEAAIAYYHEQPQTRLASLEGFVRQIIGWREFMRAVYVRDGVRQRTDNFWQHGRTLDTRWYTGETGIPPIDDAIQKAHTTAYNHHIERLMLVGNFMLLCEIHPDEVYRWFMEMFIDAYDWVMVPNVYGMSQYADGGLITTKPYISSSNYVRKMSDYTKGDWCAVWDGLYWRFIHKHVDFFKGNPRLAMMTSHLKRMSDDKLQTHLTNAERFLKAL